MDESRTQPPIPNGKGAAQFARFGVFELRLDTGELRKYGASVRLQRRSFCVLQALLERHGEVVTREELRARIWPEGTFVDFESGLNTAVNRLRCALGDSAETPVYIETMARLGYRFVAPVTVSNARQNELEEAASTPLLPNEAAAGVEAVSGRRWWMTAIGVSAAAAVISWLAGTAFSGHRSFVYKQLTFSEGFVEKARFLEDGKRIVYSSVSNGNVNRTFTTSTDGEEAASPRAEASEVVERPHGARISVNDGWFTVEYPAGRQLYRTHHLLETARAAPMGGRVAFIEHPIAGDDAGQVMIAGPAEAAHALSAGWESLKGLAWQPAGGEIWFTAATSGLDRKLRAVNLSGQVRQVAEMPGGMILLDINRAGDVLMARPSSHVSMLRGNLREKAARDVSLLDSSRVAAISADGKLVLFDESGAGGGRKHGAYLYNVDRDKAERIGDGRAVDLSADGNWALTQQVNDGSALWLVSTRDRRAAPIKADGAAYNWARFIAGRDHQEIVAAIAYPDQAERLIVQKLPNGRPVTVAAGLYLKDAVVDEAGQTVAGSDASSELVVVNISDRAVRKVALAKGAWPVAFGADGKVITRRCDGRSIVLEKLDLKSGTAEPYSELQSAEPRGMAELIGLRLAADGETFVYSRWESLSTLYWVAGWR